MLSLLNCPPMPIQMAEYVLVVFEAVTIGTVHDALTPVTLAWGFCISEETT